MYYWELCNAQKAFLCRYHMDGYSKLEVLDILKWKELCDSLERSGGAAAPSPAKHIWSLLSAELQGKLAARRPAEDRAADEQYKGEIVAEFNRLLARRDFYDPQAWAAVDLESELARLLKDGYTALQQRDRRRVRELLARQDWLRRGVNDLRDDELFAFNVAMLRAAYDGDPKLADADRDDGKIIAVSREDALDKLALWRGYRTWIILWQEINRHKHGWNTHVPTICPWRLVSEADDMTIRGVRNPFYFKVDAQGQQLPYIDMIEPEVVRRKDIRLLKLQAGSADFYERETEWADFTPLKQMEASGGYEVRLWAMDYCGELTIFLCQQHADPQYRELMGDSRFHQALSLAINRQEMIDIVWQGMGTPAQFSVPEGSKYYNPRLHHAYVDYDPERANRLLDELGLQKRAADGTRLFPSGRPVTLEVSTTDERPLAAVQLLCNYWRAVGLKPLMKVRLGDIIWRLSSMGKYDVWIHKEGGNYFGPLLAGYIVPTHEAESIQYPRWAVWLKTGGREGEEPPDRVKELDRLWRKVTTAPNEQAKVAAWLNLTDVAAEQLPVIGITTSPGKVLYVKKNFKNVPQFALAGWIAHDPGNCNPEVFYIEQGQ
jgi:ABC-type transport system substrate-binding protein